MTIQRTKHQFDRGWSWAVDVGVFIVIFVLISWIRVSGLLFVEIQSVTGASSADTAWVAAGNAMSWHFLSPVSAILAERFGTRRTVFVGGFIVFMSISSGYFIRDLSGFIIMGVCIGIGGAICFTPSVVFLSHYFRRRLGIATGIVSSGSSVSQVVMSPICGYLIERYGLPGTLLIFGAISLHLLVSAALFFPIHPDDLKHADEQYRLEIEREKRESQNNEQSPSKNEDIELEQQSPLQQDGLLKPPELSANAMHASMTSIHEITRPNVIKRILTNPNLYNLMLGFGVGSMVSMALVKYGPPYCINEYSLTMTDMSLFLALSGVPGILVRIGIGLICDTDFVRNRIERYRLFVLGIVLAAASCFVFLVANEYYGFLANFLLMGVSSGLFYTLNSVSTFDLIGREDYAVAFGVLNASCGILFIIDSTVIAHLKDVTGTFHSSFILCGTLGVVASILMLICVPIGQRFMRKKDQGHA